MTDILDPRVAWNEGWVIAFVVSGSFDFWWKALKQMDTDAIPTRFVVIGNDVQVIWWFR